MAKELTVKDRKNLRIAEESSKFFSTLWNEYQTATSAHRRRQSDFYKQYRGIPNRKNYEGFANVFVNETLSAVESITAQEMGSLFSESKYVMLTPQEKTDETKVKLNESLLLYYLEKIGHKSKLLRQVRQKNKYGTTWAKVFWDFQEKDVITKERAGVFVKKVVRDFPNYHYIDSVDIACDPGKPDIESMDWIIWRKRVTWDYIKKRERDTLYSKSQVSKIDRNKSQSKEFLSGKKERLNTIGINYQYFDKGLYDILECWAIVPRWWVDDDIDVHSEEAHELVESICECELDGPTLRLERNPFWHQEKPFVMGHFIQVDDETNGIGVCEIAESLQQELNDKRNQSLDHATEQIAPPLMVDVTKQIPDADLEIKPRKKIHVSGNPTNAVVPLQLGGNYQEQAYFDSVIKQDIRNHTSATNPIQGFGANKESTAFEVNELVQRGSARIHVSTIDFGDKFLKRLYRLMWKMFPQYLTTEKVIKILGKDGAKWETVTPEDVIEDVDIVQKIPTDVDSRSIVRNQMIQFLTQIAPFYPKILIGKLVRKVYALFPFEDVDEVVPEIETEIGQNELTNEQEIQVLLLGQRIDVKYWEDHISKIQTLINYVNKFGNQLDAKAKEAINDKINQHAKYLSVLEQMQMQAQQQPGGNGKRPGAVPQGKPRAGGGAVDTFSQMAGSLT